MVFDSGRRSMMGMAIGCAGAVLAGCGVTPDTRSGTGDLVKSAQATLETFRADAQMQWFRDNLKNARGVLISPQVVRAGFILGGSGGEALLLARDGARWVGPAFYNVGTGSIGLQIGAEISEVVVLVMSEKALDGLMSSTFNLGGDASVAAGPVGIGTGYNIMTDMVSFAKSKGAFAGLNLDGVVITPDSAANAAYYGKPVSSTDVLVRRTVSSAGAASLQRSLTDLAH